MSIALRLSQDVTLAGGSQDDFTARREKILQESRNQPTARLAALLEVLSRRNADEGRDPYLIDDDLSCRFITDLLGLSIEQLNDSLHALEARELLIVTETGSLRLSAKLWPNSPLR